MWHHNEHAWIGTDYHIYFKADRHKHTPYIQHVHIPRPILWLAGPANSLLHIWRLTLSLFFPMFLVLQELLILIELSGSINNFAISKNHPLCQQDVWSHSKKKKKKKILVNRENRPHWKVCTPIFTLVINHYPLWHWLIGLSQILQNSYENPG